jgi:ABC-type Fe3+-hydroxamate transport system substrate-binding protein
MIFTDQLNTRVVLNAVPERIVSLVPSQTELLADLGLGSRVVGITRFCVHPGEWAREKTLVGGSRKADLEKIKSLRPDLVVANKEENEKDLVDAIRSWCPVWVSDVGNLDDALDMIRGVGMVTGTEAKSEAIASRVESGFAELRPVHDVRVLYLIWRKPYMSVGGDTFIHDMLRRCGFLNVCADGSRYPELPDAVLAGLNPEFVLLPSEPFPFNEQHMAELRTVFPNAGIVPVDGEYFSWYGSRLTGAAAYFNDLLNRLFRK